MKKVFKFKLESDGWIEIPKGGEILTVNVQDRFEHAWVLFSPEASANEKEKVQIFIAATGQEIPLDCRYINTYFQGPFVWHAFEMGRAPVA